MTKDKKQVIVASVILAVLIGLMVLVVVIVIRHKNDFDSPHRNIVDAASKYVMIGDYRYQDESVFGSFSVQKVEFKNLDLETTELFLKRQQVFFNEIDGYKSDLFALADDNKTDNRVSGIATLISHDSLLSVVYQYKVDLKSLDIKRDGTFVININTDTKKIVDNATLFAENGKTLHDVATDIFDDVMTRLDFGTEIYIDLTNNKRITSDNIDNYKSNYVNLIENYLGDVPVYMNNGSVIVVYKESDILKLLFKRDNDLETKDIIYIV